jgi:GT2 family glycosyltransferase
MDTPANPTLAVCILNWNGRAWLADCLSALAAQSRPADAILLIDNGSTDDSVAFVRERFPDARVRENGGNLGFAAGNNVVLRETAADLYVLLNPDVVLAPGCLAALEEAMADPAIGIAGCKLWYPGGAIIQHAGGFITAPRAMPGHYGIGERDAGQHDAPRDVDYVIGAALAVRRETLAAVGMMDEGYFLFFEDADLCARARRAGFRVVYRPKATGIHVESATAAPGSFAYLQRFHSGRWRYLLKHFPVETILNETIPAEAAWLDQLGAAERRASGLAYLATRRKLPEIGAARARQGAGAWSPEAEQAIAAALGELWARAAAFDRPSPHPADVAVLTERPFTSAVPLIGPLIARFRTAWNNVASRWYLGHLMAQQNEFNRLVVAQLARHEAETREMLALLEEQVVITAEMELRLQELAARLATSQAGNGS